MVDVITTEADVIACYISLLLADVFANIFVVDVITTYYSTSRCFFWLMLLPCVSVVDVITTEADVIAWYILFYFILADVIANVCGRCYNHTCLTQCGGRCYCQVADGMATVGWVMVKWMMLLPLGRCYSHGSISYFNLSSGMLNRTSSHMCGIYVSSSPW